MLSIQKKISSYNFSNRNGNSIKYIVIHYTGNKGDTAKDNVDYFYGGDRSASAHFFVDNTSIWQSVEESNSAWAVGGGTSYGATNRNSLSIEMCCNSNGVVADITENNALELTKYLMNKYGVSVSNVIRHYDCNSIRKVCPNWSANNWARWNNFKAKLTGQVTTSQPSTPNTTVEKGVNRSMYMFSKNWYLKKYSDIANSSYKDDPYLHYEKYGKAEGRQPLPPIPAEFNEGAYLSLNPDVAEAVKKGTYVSGIAHYMMYGFCENRKISSSETDVEIRKRVESLELKLEQIKKIIG